MKYFLLLPLLAFTGADTWQPFVVDSHLSLQIPASPQEFSAAQMGQTLTTVRTWAARTPEAGFFVIRVPTTGNVAKGNTAQRSRYYASVVEDALAEMHSQLLSRTTFPTAGGDGIELKLRRFSEREGRPTIMYMRSFVLYSFGYNFIFQPANANDSLDVTTSAQRRRFFNSITVKP